MRMEPEEACVLKDELVAERAPGFDRVLHRERSVHAGRKPNPVPMNRRGLWQPIGEMDDQSIPNLRIDERAGDSAIVRPDFRYGSGAELLLCLPSFQFDLDDVWIGIQILDRRECERIGSGRWRCCGQRCAARGRENDCADPYREPHPHRPALTAPRTFRSNRVSSRSPSCSGVDRCMSCRQ